jgi:Xaa-Pro aminopeptidase
MTIHFSEQELQQRRQRVCDELQRRGLHAMLCFRQESDFYLSGYDTLFFPVPAAL